MKKLISFVVLLLLAGIVMLKAQTATAGAQGTVSKPNTDQYLPQGVKEFIPVFPSWEQYSKNKVASPGDFFTDGIIDTALMNTDGATISYTFYGHIWSLSQTDYWPTVVIYGADSGTVTVSYRKVYYNGGIMAVGAWTAQAGPVAIKRPTGERDTLFTNDCTTCDTAMVASGTELYQFKYQVAPTTAAYGIGAKKNKKALMAGGKQQVWHGGAGLIFRRKEQ